MRILLLLWLVSSVIVLVDFAFAILKKRKVHSRFFWSLFLQLIVAPWSALVILFLWFLESGDWFIEKMEVCRKKTVKGFRYED